MKIINNIKTLCFSVLATTTTLLPAQDRQLMAADKDFEAYAFVDAREAYIKVVEKGFVSQEVVQKIADSYYFNSEYAQGLIWYRKLYSNYGETIKPTYLFRYAQCLKSMEMYEESDQIMEKYAAATGGDQRLSEKFADERDYLEAIALQSGRFKINNLDNINTEGADFGPSFGKDGALIFASSRKANGLSKTVHEWNEAAFLDLYVTQRESVNSLYVEGLKKLDGKLNSYLHESSTVMTRDGSTLYFTRNNLLKKKKKTNKDGTVLLKLYKATRTGGDKWGNIEELPFNSDEYSVAHPALSPDETRLYFSSDMPGTLGMSDLFYVEISSDGSYGDPINLGEGINTEARETFPFISNSGSLFFASNGHPGLGGLDVFLSLPEKSYKGITYSDPYNIGEPVNSPDDDFTFIIDEETKIGFFSSNRAGGIGSDDIYSVKQIKDLVTSCEQYLNGIISDQKTNERLSDVIVTLYDQDMNKVEMTTSDEKGRYELPIECANTYIIRATKKDYEPAEENFVSNEVHDFTHNLPLQLEKGKLLEKVDLRVGDDLTQVLQLEPIYFDLNKSYIRPDAEVELQKVLVVLQEHPDMKIDVRSHTDSRASHAYNRSLSDRRANSTIAYLVRNGIDENRLTGRGYGETRLVNACSDGVTCTEEEHQLNRRSEFIILKL